MPKPIRSRDLTPVPLEDGNRIRVVLYDFGDHSYTLILCRETKEAYGGYSWFNTDQEGARLYRYTGNFNRKHFESFPVPDLDQRVAAYAKAKGITLPTTTV